MQNGIVLTQGNADHCKVIKRDQRLGLGPKCLEFLKGYDKS